MEMMGFCNDVYPPFVEDNKPAIPGARNRDREHCGGEQLTEAPVDKAMELREKKKPKITEGQQPETPERSKTASKNKSLKRMQLTWKKLKALKVSNQG